MRKFGLWWLLFISLGVMKTADADDHNAIEQVLNTYIQGTAYNHVEHIDAAFNEHANLYLEKSDTPLWVVPVNEYRGWFNPKKKGQFNGRIGEILAIDREGHIATAKVEIIIPHRDIRFIDMFLLKKLDKQWQIISKSALQANDNSHGERILFILSNAHFHGDTTLPAGASFSEIVKAYDVFKNAGYTVDFVTPQGGAVPLSYINTSDPIHKKYLYNQDFMYGLKHSKMPQDIRPADYRAVHYVGGSNAMYGVAENVALQNIAMAIYEKHHGIISSVCHGTAGIVNLQLSNGDYLVKGRRISGYPEAFENPDKAYFAEFPFMIDQVVKARGGDFIYGDRNQAHVEVDGRIVTGQNHLSSAIVAERMIEVLKNTVASQ